MTGTTKVFFYYSHAFEDDRDFAVSRDRYWINVHDAARDKERQLAIAQRVFNAMKAQVWPTKLSFNPQHTITAYP